ncbi:hypothetical protein U1Q18_044098 [Sarracenia purpurea var. burkii]
MASEKKLSNPMRDLVRSRSGSEPEIAAHHCLECLQFVWPVLGLLEVFAWGALLWVRSSPCFYLCFAVGLQFVWSVLCYVLQ